MFWVGRPYQGRSEPFQPMIDITRPLDEATAAWPGDTELSIDWTLQIDRGDTVSVSRITLSPHVGTHADAPAHYMADGALSGTFRLAAFLGPAKVIDASDCDSLSVEHLQEREAIGSPRLLVRTLEHGDPTKFVSEFPPLDAKAAETLLRAGLVLFGTDAPSVDPVDSKTMDAHRMLGAAGVPILENLDLAAAEPGDYDLLALPVKLMQTEAAPVRAVLLPPGTLVTGNR